MWKSRVVGIGLILSMLMAACSRPAVQEVDKWQKLVEETNRTIQMEPLQVTEYSIKVGARLTKPEHKKFAANSSFVISGSVQEYTTMKSDSVWVLIRKMNQNASSVNDDFSYYAPIRDGVFEQNVQLPDGAGEYRVVVRLPSTDSKDRYYDLTEFHVFNVNDEIKRDIAFTMPGRNSGLNISRPETGYSKTEGVFDLQGSILNYPATNRFVMIRLEKDEKKWEHLIPIKEGKFEARLPLHYGLGVHKLTVMAPDPTRKDYFLEAAYLFLDNQSAKTSEPIQYFKTYQERGVRLDTPLTGGEEAQLKYRISGAIDPNVPDADKTTHVIVQTKKDKDVATYLIPVQNYIFDGEIWLRFGRGTYEVTVNVPETNNPLRGYHQFYSVAKFTVVSTASEDKRNLLPSRGIQSDAPEIIELANKLTEGIKTDREKAEAIYAYVAQNVRYDVEKFRNDDFRYDDSAIKTLQTKEGVCQDYSFLTIALLRALNMESRFVEGFARGNRHAWVEVKVNGDWLVMDPTWGAGYIDQNNQFVAKYSTDYFDPSPDLLKKTHSRTGVMY